MNTFKRVKWLLATACLAAGFAQSAAALEVEGIKLEDSAKVANRELLLNGAGIRFKVIFKVYVAGLYLPEKKTSTADILALNAPRRIKLVMLRDVSNEDFGQSFMAGINANSDRAEKSKVVNQMMKFGEMFAAVPTLKKGDVITVDWVPETGTVIHLNGKSIVEPLPDVNFYNVLLKIWLGDKPADNTLKQNLLGGKS
jgi:hypothetical protein